MNPGFSIQGELKNLLRQSSHYLFGLVASLALGFISFPIFTRIFSVADYGLIDFAQKIVLLVVAVCKCGLQNSAMRFYDRKKFDAEPGAERRYYSTMFFAMAAPAAAMTILFALFLKASAGRWIDARLEAVLMLGGALILLRAAQSMIWTFFRVQERTKAYNVANVAIRAATIAAVCLLLPVFGASARTYFGGTLAVEAAVIAMIVFPLFRTGMISLSGIDPVMLRASFAFGLPLVIQEISGIVLDSGDRAVIRHFMGDEALGLYSVAYGLSSYVNTLLMVPLGLAITPFYMRIWNTEGRERTIDFLSQTLNGFLIAAVFINVLAAVCARDAVSLMASSRYAGAEKLIPTLVAGLLVYTAQVFLNAGLLIGKETGKLAMILGVSAILNLGLNWLWVPSMGLQAAALATLGAYLFATVLTAGLSFKVLPLRISIASAAKYALAGAVAWLLASLVELNQPVLNLAGRSVAVCAAYAGMLYLTDPQVRAIAATLVRALQRREAPSAASLVTNASE